MTFANYPGTFFALFTVLLIALILLWTHRGAELRKRWVATIALYAINLAVALILLVLIWDPSASRDGDTTIRNEVLVYIDTSESMSVRDGENDTTRLDRVAERIAQLFPEEKGNRPALRLMGFDKTPYPCRSLDALSRWGTESNLVSAVATVARATEPGATKAHSSSVAGALLFTDGQADQKALTAYAHLADRDVPIAVVGVGASNEQHDVRIQRLDVPRRTIVDAPYTVHVALGGDLEAVEGPITLTLLQNGRHVREHTFTEAERVSDSPLAIPLFANSVGTDQIEVQLSGMAQDANQSNNHRTATVSVVEEPRLRTLFYTQWLGPDIGRVRSALARTQKVELEIRINARRVDVNAFRAAALAAPGQPQFPDTAEALQDYDLIILGPCDPTSFSQPQIDALYHFVSQRGGGLLLLPGAPGYDIAATRDATLRSLYPAELTPYTGASTSNGHRPPALTTVGDRMRLIPTDLFEDLNAELIPAYLAQPKPAATTIAVTEEDPAVCIQRVGRGYTALLNLRGLFQLYRENENGGPLQTLLSGLVTYLGAAPGSESRLELYAERTTETPGDVRFRAVVLDEHYRPASDATVLLTFDGQAIRMAPQGEGNYEAIVPIGSRETVLSTVEAAQQGHHLGERTLALRLPAMRDEMDQTDADHRFLEQLATHVGGSYYELNGLPQSWVDELPATTTVPVAGKPHSIWRSWLLFSLVCATLSANWFARRMLGLL